MKRLNTEQVIQFLQKRRSKKFTTGLIAKRFKVKMTQATAGVAIMRIKGIIERDDPPKDPNGGGGRWVFTG